MAKKRNIHYWFVVGLIGVLLEAPNATAIKYAITGTDPYLFTAYRFLIVAVLTLPFIILALRKLNTKNTKNILLAGLHMTIAIYAYTWALKLGPASYVSIVTLLSPILLVIFSIRMVGERIDRRSVAGITLAAIGAMVIVILPIAINQGGSFEFYPMSTILTLIQCISFSLAIIYSKQANEQGVPMSALIGIYAWFVAAISFVLAILNNVPLTVPDTTNFWLIVYSGIGVALAARAMTIVSYEHIGSAVTSALSYLGSFLSILVPVFILNEKISVEMVFGGILILFGIYIVEHHKSPHYKHHQALKNH